MRIAINGFGRIGRCVLRAVFELNATDIEVIAINTPGSEESCAHLLKYDSVHGTFNHQITSGDGYIAIDNKKIVITRERDITKLDWKKYNIDIVLECSGIFNSREKALNHINAGAKKVLISAPATDADCTIVYGVNNNILKNTDQIISIGSCTTNCLAPILDVLHKNFYVESGFMTTIHSYTNDQNIVDNNHKKDLRRARACALSMIPTDTGAAKTIGKIIPDLAGKINGTAVRVPTANVSLVDLVVNCRKDIDVDSVKNAFLQAEQSYLNRVLTTCNEPLVSIDFNHNSSSAIFDLSGTYIVNNKLLRVAAWYDNEWGFSSRMIDVLRLMQ